MAIDPEERHAAMRAERKAARMAGTGGIRQPMRGDDDAIQIAGLSKILMPLLGKKGKAFGSALEEVQETGRSATVGTGRPVQPVTPQTRQLLSKDMEQTAKETFDPIIKRAEEDQATAEAAAASGSDSAADVRLTDDQLRELLRKKKEPVIAERGTASAEQEAEFLDKFDYSKQLEENYGIKNPLADADTNQILKFIEAPDDVDRAIAIVAEMYGDTTKVQKDTVTRQMAAAMNVSETVLDKNMKTWDSSTILASRHLLALSGQNVAMLTRQINNAGANASPMMHYQLRRSLALHATINNRIRGVRAETGRALRAWSMNIDIEDPIQSMKQIDALLAENGGVEASRTLARKLQEVIDARGEAGLNTFSLTGAYAKTKEAIHFAWKAGLLFNPRSQGKNIIGNFLLMFGSIPESAVAGLYSSGERAVRRTLGMQNMNEGVYMGETLARTLAVSHAFRDALRLAGKSLMEGTATNPNGKIESISGADIPISGDAARTVLGDKIGNRLVPENGFVANAIDYIGKAIGIPFRSLQSADEFFRTVVERMQIYELAYRESARVLNDNSSKTTGEAFEKAVNAGAEILADPMKVKEELIAHADYMTLVDEVGKTTGDTGDQVAKSFYSAARATQRSALGGFIIGFLKAPINVVKRIAERNPMMAALYPKIYREILSGDPAVRAKAIGRLGFGSGMMVLGLTLAQEGRLTGAHPRDRKKRELLKSLDWQPFSIVWRGEGVPENQPLFDENGIPTGKHNYLSIAGLEPIGALLSIPAAAYERMKRAKTIDHESFWRNFDEFAFAATMESMRYVKNLPFLEGMTMVTKAIDGLYREKDGSYAPDVAKLLEKFGGTFYGPLPNPVSSMQRAVARELDPTKRDITAWGERYTHKEIETSDDPNVKNNWSLLGVERNSPVANALRSFGNAQNSIKIWNADDPYYIESEINKDQLPTLYDPAGFPEQEGTGLQNDIFTSGWNMMMPMNLKTAGKSRINKDLRASLSEAYRVGANLSHSHWNSFKGVDLSPHEKAEWVRLAKNEVTIQGMTYREALEEVPFRTDYETAKLEDNDHKIRKIYNNIHEDYRNAVMGKFDSGGNLISRDVPFQFQFPETYELILEKARWAAPQAKGGADSNPAIPGM